MNRLTADRILYLLAKYTPEIRPYEDEIIEDIDGTITIRLKRIDRTIEMFTEETQHIYGTIEGCLKELDVYDTVNTDKSFDKLPELFTIHDINYMDNVKKDTNEYWHREKHFLT